jgi:hypothetical protein
MKLGSSRKPLSQRESRTGIEPAPENQRTKDEIGFVSHGAFPTRRPNGNLVLPGEPKDEIRNWVRLARPLSQRESQRESSPRWSTHGRRTELGSSRRGFPTRKPMGIQPSFGENKGQSTKLGSSRKHFPRHRAEPQPERESCPQPLDAQSEIERSDEVPRSTRKRHEL